jgi:hypothetical protein
MLTKRYRAQGLAAKVGIMVFQMLLGSWLLVLVRLCGDLLVERSRRTTACRVVRALSCGGLVVDVRGRHNVIMVYVPPQPLPPQFELSNARSVR